MGFRLPGIKRASKGAEIPKGFFAVYVGDNKRRFVIPISFLNQPTFQDLLSQSEEEFGYSHPTGGLTIPCTEDVFLNVTSSFNGLYVILSTSKTENPNLSETALATGLLFETFEMGFRFPAIRRASFTGSQSSSKAVNMAKGYFAVYVGERMKRFVIPMSYLNQPSFQDLLSQAEEEFGYNNPMGGLTIPCTEDVFLHVISSLNGL
ncbi:uncharacterized protein LOC124841956 [Vigna umbellata]|nr:uncharacterized protein LOC124841956 [Vigna umbellata]